MNMHSAREQIDIESRKDPASLEREIDAQRDSIGEIVSALEDKLSPGQMLDRVMRAGKGGGGEFARNLGDTVKSNPMPALLATAGLVWLYASRNHHTAPSGDRPHKLYADPSLDADHSSSSGIGERAAHLRDDMAGKLGDAKSRIGDSAHAAGESMRHQAQRAKSGFDHLLHDNPMAAGAMAVAVGALLGAIVPVTQTEDRLMGDASDRLTDKARQAASQAMSKGKEAAREIAASGEGAEGRNGGDDAQRHGGGMSSGGAQQTGATV